MNLFLDELRLRQEGLLKRRSKECLKYNKDKQCIDMIDKMLDNISKRITYIVHQILLNDYKLTKEDQDFLIQIIKDETQFKDWYRE